LKPSHTWVALLTIMVALTQMSKQKLGDIDRMTVVGGICACRV